MDREGEVPPVDVAELKAQQPTSKIASTRARKVVYAGDRL
jgi:hypothetical protein